MYTLNTYVETTATEYLCIALDAAAINLSANVHSIVCYTVIKNQYKFIHEGFYLTDLVNCQVYKGNMYNDKNIIEAVRETNNLILVDENMDYITAAYFSNSGGQTNNVEDVWIKALPYLRSIYDPYSLGGTNYEWQKSINKKYLNRDSINTIIVNNNLENSISDIEYNMTDSSILIIFSSLNINDAVSVTEKIINNHSDQVSSIKYQNFNSKVKTELKFN